MKPAQEDSGEDDDDEDSRKLVYVHSCLGCWFEYLREKFSFFFGLKIIICDLLTRFNSID